MAMTEEIMTIATSKPEEEVYKEIEEALSPMGQVSVSRKGAINLNPKSKFGNFLSEVALIEGHVRKRKDGESYDVTLNYAVKATLWCWILAFLFLYLAGPLLLLIPHKLVKGNLQKALEKALIQAKRELDS